MHDQLTDLGYDRNREIRPCTFNQLYSSKNSTASQTKRTSKKKKKNTNAYAWQIHILHSFIPLLQTVVQHLLKEVTWCDKCAVAHTRRKAQIFAQGEVLGLTSNAVSNRIVVSCFLLWFICERCAVIKAELLTDQVG